MCHDAGLMLLSNLDELYHMFVAELGTFLVICLDASCPFTRFDRSGLQLGKLAIQP